MATLESQLEYYKRCTHAAELRLDRALQEVKRLEEEVERVKLLHDERVDEQMKTRDHVSKLRVRVLSTIQEMQYALVKADWHGDK